MSCATLAAPDRRLQTCVVVPARNEAEGIEASLAAICQQVDFAGKPLPPESFEILVLANNCTDATAAIAREVGRRNPQYRLHVCETTFPEEHANIGHARRWLMECAARRLAASPGTRIIASTDADTVVAPDWLAAIYAEFARGVDAVGGRILTGHPGDGTDPALRRYHLNDVTFQHLIAELEAHLDPVPHDPWPRHYQHFGANFAVTVDAYLSVGGLPLVHTLEDMMFFEVLRRADLRVRHSSRVRVQTSSRRSGRVAIGLSTQLGEWADALASGMIPLVEAASSAEERMRERRAWREWWHGVRDDPPEVAQTPVEGWESLARTYATFGAFYDATQADRPLCELESVTDAIGSLRQRLIELRNLPALPLLLDALEEVEPVRVSASTAQVA